jgi:hypothetical protein
LVASGTGATAGSTAIRVSVVRLLVSQVSAKILLTWVSLDPLGLALVPASRGLFYVCK